MDPLEIKFIGFAPDADPTTPGVMPVVAGIVPTVRGGFTSPPSAFDVGQDALAAACKGAAAVRKLDDSSRLFAGTATNLYEASGSSWVDVTRSSGGDYSLGADSRWRFAQFGNYSYAASKADNTQVSDTSGAFADLGNNAPKANVLETCAGFLMALDYDDGSNDYPDGWYCSPYQNPNSDWTASVATQAAYGRLLDTPGPIRAGKRLGNSMVAYKERSIYLGFYDGPPVIWRWQLVPGEAGAVSQEAVVEVTLNGSPVHFFAGFSDFYVFDGSRPVSIGARVRRWYQNNVSAQYRYRIQAMVDRAQRNVYFLLPSDDGVLTRFLIYNVETGNWGLFTAASAIESLLDYVTGGITYHSLGSLYSTYDDLPTDISYDSPFWTSQAQIPAYFTASHGLATLTGIADTASGFFGHVIGDHQRFRTLTRVRPKYLKYPSGTSALTVYYDTTDLRLDADGLLNVAGTSLAASNLSGGKHDLLVSAKWFQPYFSMTAAHEIAGFTAYYEEDGDE